MTKKITTREWEAISAYLDGQLAPRERTRLETRLQAEPDLQTALDEMRRTRTLLRSQPRRRAPRNFTLTPQMVRAHQRPASWSFGALRLTSALASLLLVLALVGDLFTSAPAVAPAARTSAQEPAAEFAFAETPLSPEEAAAATNAPPGLGGEPIPSQKSAAPEAGAAAETEAPAIMMVAPTEVAPTEAAGATAAEAEEQAAAVEAPAAEAATGEAAPAEVAPEANIAQAPLPTLQSAEDAEAPQAAVEGIPQAPAPELEADTADTAREESTAAGQDAPPATRPPLFGLDQGLLRMAEVALALVALATGLAAFLLRRSR